MMKKSFFDKMILKMIVLAALMALMALCASCALAQGAVIDNGDGAAMLNLREQPQKSAAVLGKFLSGTRLEILGDAGNGWSEVAIGTGMGTVKGYMMTQYLSASARVDATYAASVVSPYGTQSVVLRDGPSNSYDAVAMLMVGDRVLVIGEMNGFRFVETSGGCVGCLLDKELK